MTHSHKYCLGLSETTSSSFFPLSAWHDLMPPPLTLNRAVSAIANQPLDAAPGSSRLLNNVIPPAPSNNTVVSAYGLNCRFNTLLNNVDACSDLPVRQRFCGCLLTNPCCFISCRIKANPTSMPLLFNLAFSVRFPAEPRLSSNNAFISTANPKLFIGLRLPHSKSVLKAKIAHKPVLFHTILMPLPLGSVALEWHKNRGSLF